PSPLNLKTHQLPKAIIAFKAVQPLHIVTESHKIFLRQIDSSLGGVLAQIAEDVGELKGDTGALRIGGSPIVHEAPDMDARQAHGRGDAVTIAVQVGEGDVANLRQVHLHTVQDRLEVRGGDTVDADRVMESRVQRMTIVAQ